nr:unnamed protein product [Spirometra erinaceieuropaei]
MLLCTRHFEAPVSSDGTARTGEQITALSAVVTFTAGGQRQPGVRRPTRDIDPLTRPNSRLLFPNTTAADQRVKLWGEAQRPNGSSSGKSDRAGGRGHTSTPEVGHGET